MKSDEVIFTVEDYYLLLVIRKEIENQFYRITYLSQLLYSSFKIKDYAFFLLKNFTTLNYSHSSSLYFILYTIIHRSRIIVSIFMIFMLIKYYAYCILNYYQIKNTQQESFYIYIFHQQTEILLFVIIILDRIIVILLSSFLYQLN